MIKQASIMVLAAVAASRAAAALPPACIDLKVPVTVSASNVAINLEAPSTNIDATNFMLNWTQFEGGFTDIVQQGNTKVSGTYEIAATYCKPTSGLGTTVHLLTHGIGYDRRYWNVEFDDYEYSYVQAATERGYSTFSWDRLGISESQHGDAVNEIQSWLEVEALHALATQLRAGEVGAGIGPFEKVVGIGHSFGSIQTYTTAQMYPDALDAIVLTGFGQNGTFVPYFGLAGNFVVANSLPAFAGYPDGYLAAGDISAVQTNFFAPGQFDPEVLEYAFNTLGQPVTVGELITILAGAGKVNDFEGPVLIITGERDIPFCGGNCLATGDVELPSIPASSRTMFPNATVFEAAIVPKAGHGLNLEYSHSWTYKTILDFINGQSL